MLFTVRYHFGGFVGERDVPARTPEDAIARVRSVIARVPGIVRATLPISESYRVVREREE